MMIRFEIIETSEKEKIDHIIGECDKAFPNPIRKRKIYPKLLEKIVNYAIFAYAYGENVMGYIVFYANNQEYAYVSLIAVDPKMQNQHIGSALLKYCELKSKEKGISAIRLEVKKENQEAISFYKAKGFQWEKEKDERSIYMIKKI